MLSSKETALIYETLLSSPGMNDTVKLDLRVPRKTILLLSKLIELGLSLKSSSSDSLLAVSTAETLEEIKSISDVLLSKAGLSEMFEKINALGSK